MKISNLKGERGYIQVPHRFLNQNKFCNLAGKSNFFNFKIILESKLIIYSEIVINKKLHLSEPTNRVGRSSGSKVNCRIEIIMIYFQFHGIPVINTWLDFVPEKYLRKCFGKFQRCTAYFRSSGKMHSLFQEFRRKGEVQDRVYDDFPGI